jgi:hypothetical protein
MNVTVRGRTQPCRTVAFDRARNAVLLIEQRLLPHEFKIVATRNFRETAAAIHDMIVRGAGAIGATAWPRARWHFTDAICQNFAGTLKPFIKRSKPRAPPPLIRSTP